MISRLWDNFFHGKAKKTGKRKKVLVLLEWENLQKNIGFKPGEASLKKRLDACLRDIAEQIGSIDVFVFMPPHGSHVWGEQLHKAGFFIIVCPKIRNKAGGETDTTDETLIKFGERMLDRMEDLTHLCVGSGDIDFSPLLIRAGHKGLKTMLIVTAIGPLNEKLIPFIDFKPDGTGRMIYALSSYK